MVSTMSSMAQFHLLGQDNQKEMQHNIFGHVMPMTSSMALLHLLPPDKQTVVQNDIFTHVMHLVLALSSCNVDGFVNGTNQDEQNEV